MDKPTQPFQYKARSTRSTTKRNNEEKDNTSNKKQKIEKEKVAEKKTKGKETKKEEKAIETKNKAKKAIKDESEEEIEMKDEIKDSKSKGKSDTTSNTHKDTKNTKEEEKTENKKPPSKPARRPTLRTKNNRKQQARDEEKLLLTKTSSAFAELVLLKQKESSLDFLFSKYTKELTEWEKIKEMAANPSNTLKENELSKERQQKLKNDLFSQIPNINCNPSASLDDLSKSAIELQNGLAEITTTVKESEEKCKELARFIHVETSKAYKDFDKPKKIINTIQSTNINNDAVN